MRDKLLLILILAVALFALISVRAQNPEDARKKLQQRNIPFSEPSFVESARSGDDAAVSLFLASGMTPNTRDARDLENSSVLMAAAMDGQTGIVKTLIAAGADVNATTTGGRTALMWAAWRGRTETVQALLSAGADRDAQDKGGSTALRFALSRNHIETAKTLIHSGINLHAKTTDNKNSLIFAVVSGSSDVVGTLLDKGADLNSKDGSGRTALMIAVDRGNIDLVRTLIEHGADVNARDRYNRTPITQAKATRQTAIVGLLEGQNAGTSPTTANSWP